MSKEVTEKIEEKFAQNALYVFSFLGGITFAALILLLQSSQAFSQVPPSLSVLAYLYPRGLILGTAIISVLFIGSSLGMVKPASGIMGAKRDKTKIAGAMSNLAFVGLMILMPLLLVPISPTAALIIAVIEAIVFFLLYIY
jgi:hypothetical protein